MYGFIEMLCIFPQIWYLVKTPPDPPFPLQEDRRQSVSRQPSFTYSEWTEDKNDDDFLDLDPVPETPVFDCVMDMKVETDPATLTVKSVGLQERQKKLMGICKGRLTFRNSEGTNLIRIGLIFFLLLQNIWDEQLLHV